MLKYRNLIALAIFYMVSFAIAGLPRAHAALNIKNVNDLNKKVLCPIAGAMFSVFITVTVAIVIWAAYLYLSAGGDTEKIRTANRTITYAAIAVIVAILAKAFPLIVASILPGAGPIQAC